MRESFCTFDYATIRLVPRVEREEFFNVGVILSCPTQKYLESKIFLDEAKLKCFAPEIELNEISQYLEIIPKICAGGNAAGSIGKLSQRERFYWLIAERSTIIQNSRVHTGFCRDAKQQLEHLFDKNVR